MANIHLDNGPPPANATIGGEDHDRCPRDGCITVDPEHRIGGRSPRGAEHYLFSIYGADPRKGGCGATWTRTGAQQHAKNQRKGMATQYRTRSAAVERYTSMPSEAYRERFDLIDWSR
jgi:hypothetical protein